MKQEVTMGFDIESIPELETMVAMPGANRRAEVGGATCSDTGVLVATIVFGIGVE